MSDLTLSRDRKVAPMGIWQAKEQRWVPRIRNSFGLPSGKTCPGRTPWCKDICYGANAERGYTGVGDALQRNLDALLEAGTVEGMSDLLIRMVGKFASAADRWQLPPADRVFRIHWDGDFFSRDYACAWAYTIRRYPDISFWAYTRSFREPLNVVPILAGVPNLALYLSADEHNIEDAVEMTERYAGVNLARCGADYDEARDLSKRPAVICPENDGRLALMNDGRGACVECRLCVEGRGDVLFATKLPTDQRRLLPVIVGGVKQPKVIRHCQHVACGKELPEHKGPGRPLDYCDERCRWAAANWRRQQERGSAAQTAATAASGLSPSGGNSTGAEPPVTVGTKVLRIPLAAIVTDGENFRQDMGDLDSLASSLQSVGMVTLPVVRPAGDGRYELVAGHRRLSALELAGEDEADVLYLDLDERQKWATRAAENAQRKNLTPSEEGRLFKRLLGLGFTHVELEEMVGHSNNYVNMRLRLLDFEDFLIRQVDAGEISLATAFKLSARSDGRAGHNKARLHHGVHPKRGRPSRSVAAGSSDDQPESILVSTFVLEETVRYLSLVVPGLDGMAKARGLRLLRSLNAVLAREEAG